MSDNEHEALDVVAVPRYVVESILKTGAILTRDSDALRQAAGDTLNRNYLPAARRLLAVLSVPLARAMEREGL